MILLKKVRLINWYAFSNETAPVGRFTLIAGKNGNGKSVLLDAVKYAAYGDTVFNKSSESKGSRTLSSYTRGLLDATAGTYMRPSDRFPTVYTHIALEFFDELADRYFVLGTVIETSAANNCQTLRYVMNDRKLDEVSHTYEDNGAVRPYSASGLQKAYGLEGISFPHCYATVYAIPAPLFNKLFDLIGLGKIKADPKSLQDKLGVFGDTTVIGFLIGLLLSLIAGMGVGTSISTAISFAAIILLFPTVIGFLVEGLMPISNAARTMMLKKFHSDDYYIGLDCAVGVGQPANMVVNVLAIPFIFILALVLPGVNVLPAGGIAVAAAFWCSYAMPYFDNNIVKGLLYCVIMMVPSLYAATWVAPYLTDAYIAAGGAVETGTQITCSTPYLYSDLFAWIASLFH